MDCTELGPPDAEVVEPLLDQVALLERRHSRLRARFLREEAALLAEIYQAKRGLDVVLTAMAARYEGQFDIDTRRWHV